VESAQLPPPENEDVTLPNPPPPEPQQIETSAVGGEQVEATMPLLWKALVNV
jgi:hypothetical protein